MLLVQVDGPLDGLQVNFDGLEVLGRVQRVGRDLHRYRIEIRLGLADQL